MPLWVYSPLAKEWRKPHQAGALARWTPGMTLNLHFLDGEDVPEEVSARAVELVRDSSLAKQEPQRSGPSTASR